MNEILVCKNLTKQFSGNEVLKNIDFSLESGKIIGLLGPNGAGKTTLIKLINGLLQPSKGEIYIDGMKPGVETKEIISYLPDKDYLNSWMTVRQLIQFFSDFYKDFSAKTALSMMKDLGISEKAKLKELSKGNREKVQLILVMSRKAKLYLLDEPIGGVDPAARDYILRTILQNYSEDAAVLISTHLIGDVESILDHAIFISDGEIIVNTSVDELREEQGMSVDAYFREVFRC